MLGRIGLAFLLVLPLLADAQSYAGGMGKVTWASTEPDKCLAFFEAFLPSTVIDANECANNRCPCGRQGRVALSNITGGVSGLDSILAPWEDADELAQINSFGVHTVACDHHPAGAVSVGEVEARLQAQWDGLAKFDPTMDLNAGFWVPDVGPFVTRLSATGYDLLGQSWQADGTTYFSVLVNPCGFVLLELISNVSTAPSSALDFTTGLPRFWFTEGKWNAPTSPDAPLTPIKVSRAVMADTVDESAAWYIKYTGATVLRDLSFSAENTRVVELQFPSAATFRSGDYRRPIHPPTSPAVTLQLWSRPPEAPKPGAWGVNLLQQYLLAANRRLIESPSCGFTRWLDVHVSHDCWDDQACNTTRIAQQFTEDEVLFRWVPFSGDGTAGQYALYAVDPTGFGFETHYWTSVVPEAARPDDDALPPGCFGAFDNGTCAGDNGTCS